MLGSRCMEAAIICLRFRDEQTLVTAQLGFVTGMYIANIPHVAYILPVLEQ
jgi:hypothetical protein